MKLDRITLFFLAAVALAACGPGPGDDGDTADTTAETSGATAASSATLETTVTDSGLIINEISAGDGDVAAAGQTAVVHYTGWLHDPAAESARGDKFDSSRDRGQPFSFPLGAGRVIRGWDEGVAGMQVGGRRELVIPPELGYGARGAGGAIPPNATLVFDVELLGLE
jgi:FKBP-type peptidyl-prolyl cis-trans isomerase